MAQTNIKKSMQKEIEKLEDKLVLKEHTLTILGVDNYGEGEIL